MKKAFTLVELIVVITILAILGTIGFISLQGYSASARDAKRISDISSLASKINIEQIRGTNLSDLIEIGSGYIASGSILGNINDNIITFGKINFDNLRETRSNFLDPSTKDDYKVAYAVGIGSGGLRYNFFEIGTISEKEGVTKIVGNYYRLETEDIPSLFLSGALKYENNSGPLIYSPNDNYTPPIQEPNEPQEPENPIVQFPRCESKGQLITDSGEYYTNRVEDGGGTCDTQDIIICSGEGTGYQIAACNAGATIAGTHTGCAHSSQVYNLDNQDCSPDKVGYHYQWLGGEGGTNGIQAKGFAITDTEIINFSTAQEKGFLPAYTGSTTDIWTINTPCLDGYKLPSINDWNNIILAGNEVLWHYYGDNWIDGEFTDNNIGGNENLANYLHFPKSGRRGFGNSRLFYIGSYGFYLTDTIGNESAFYFLRIGENHTAINIGTLGNAISARCIKDA